jgi:hypothetical protein
MAKRSKNGEKAVADAKPAAESAPRFTPSPPRKNAPLFILSIVLFAAWFAFLLVTALGG